MKKFKVYCSMVALGGLLAVLPLADFSGQVTKGKERPLLTQQLMKGLVGAQCGALKKAIDAGPTSDEQWAGIALHAALLNEASYILMADGRCPDGTWAMAATKMLREGSANVLKAAEKKDAAAAKEAFGAMTKACGTCHKAHKKKKKSV